MNTVPTTAADIVVGDTILIDDISKPDKVIAVRDCPGGYACLRSSRRNEPCRILELESYGDMHFLCDAEVEVAPAEPQAEPQVWMAAARQSLDMHRLETGGGARTACGRSTGTGVRLAEAEAVERYGACRCPRCWPAAPKCRECGRASGAGHKMDCTQGRQPTAPTRGQRIADELRELADRIETAGDDAPTPNLNINCGWPRTASEVSDMRKRVERIAELLGLPTPTTTGGGAGRCYNSRRSNAIRVWVHCSLPECTCAHCGQECGCGGGS